MTTKSAHCMSVNFFGAMIVFFPLFYFGKSQTLKPDCRTILSVCVGVCECVSVFYCQWPTNRPNIILKSTQIVFYSSSSLLPAISLHWNCDLCCSCASVCEGMCLCDFILEFRRSQFYCFCFCFGRRLLLLSISLFLFHFKFGRSSVCFCFIRTNLLL